MTDSRNPPPAFQKGYALCSPENVLQPDTFRKSEKKAIASAFKERKNPRKAWEKAVEKGWSVRLVYMRLFVPVFYSTAPEPDGKEDYDSD